jgi:hypothetical protein
MELQDVSVDADGELELTSPKTAPRHGEALDTAESNTAQQADAVTVLEEVTERQVQQEAERSVIAEAREEATSAEPFAPGAQTMDRPPAE